MSPTQEYIWQVSYQKKPRKNEAFKSDLTQQKNIKDQQFPSLI